MSKNMYFYYVQHEPFYSRNLRATKQNLDPD